MESFTLTITPKGQYGFGLVLDYLRSSPSAILERFTDNGFYRALDIGPTGVVVKIKRENLLLSCDPLEVTVWAEDLSFDIIDQIKKHLCQMLTLDIDGSSFENSLVHDPILGTPINSFKGFRPVLLGSPWEAFLWAVVGQLIGAQQAKTIRHKLVNLRNWKLEVQGYSYNLVPSPDWISQQQLTTLQSIGITRAKATAISQAAKAITNGTMPWTNQLIKPNEQTLDQLQQIPGVGPWTIAIVDLRGFGNLQRMPFGDAALQILIGRHINPQGERLSTKALTSYVSRWAPYGGWVTYLWWLQAQTNLSERSLTEPKKKVL